MSVASESKQSGRRPITIAELLLDKCTHTYSTAPCTAALGVTGRTYCYNTRATCQDTENYNPEPAVYRFCTAQSPLPLNLDAIPSLQAVQLSPTKIDVSGGLGARASVSLTFQDHPYHDRALDPYFRLRSRAEAATALQAVEGAGLQASPGFALQAIAAGARTSFRVKGTYWGRMRARTPYYFGRVCRVLTGYLTDDGFDPANFSTRTYLIESLSGPDPNGRVLIKAKDPLKLADDDRAQAPFPSPCVLANDIDEAETVFLVDSGEDVEEHFTETGFLRIGSEVMEYTRFFNSFTVERAQFGTQAETHSEGDTVQWCLRYAAKKIPEIQYDLLHTYARIDDAFLPVVDWEAEADVYLPRTYSTLISAPTPVKNLIKELCQQGPYSTWYDERAAVVKLRALREPDDDALTLNEDQHLIADSFNVTDKPDLRVSQAWIYLAQSDPTGGLEDPTNYRQLSISADLEAEGPTKFGIPAISKLFSRWLTSRSNADELGLRLVQLFGEQPRQITFALDAKDAFDVWTGDILRVSTRQVQDENGENQVLAVQIIEANESEAGHRFTYVAQAFNFSAPIDTGLVISIAVDRNDVNLRDLFIEDQGVPPDAATVVLFVVEAGVIVGQEFAECALDTGIWPAGAVVQLENNGRIQGKGGRGAGFNDGALMSGGDGGTAMIARVPITFNNSGDLWGGGGGGMAERNSPGGHLEINSGGGGAGTIPGQGGTSADKALIGGDWTPRADSADGTSAAGGAADTSGDEADGGAGGGPGEDGSDGPDGVGGDDLTFGQAGYYLIGNTYVTWTATGDRRGPVLS